MSDNVNDRLTDLLREADVAAGAPPKAPAGFAGQIRQRACRQRRNRRAVLAAAALIAVATGLSLVMPTADPIDRSGPVVEGGANVVELPANVFEQVDRLVAEADSREAMVQRMTLAEQHAGAIAQWEQQRRQPDALDRIDGHVDKAAQLAMARADDLLEVQRDKQAAIEAYRRVVEVFSETRWAVVARRRLQEINGS